MPGPRSTDPGSLRFRKAAAADVAALRDLIGLSARGLSAGHYTPAQVEGALAGAFGVDTGLIRDGTYWVAEQGGRLLACGGWSRQRALYGSDALHGAAAGGFRVPGRDPALVRAVFVHPDAARRGIGRCLVGIAELEARANGFTALELMATLPGVPLYRALGYHPLGEATHPLPDGGSLDLVRMRKAF